MTYRLCQAILTMTGVSCAFIMAPMETLGQKIRLVRESLVMSQQELALKCGVSRPAVAQWESDATKPVFSRMEALADALGVSAAWLAYGDKDAHPLLAGASPIAASPRHRVPVISYVQAGNWTEVSDPYAPSAGLDEIHTDLDVGPHAFSLIIMGESMEPDFREGDKVIIDPDIQPRPGDYVVAKLANESEATFKKYRPRGSDKDGQPIIELVPLNPDWPTLGIDSDRPGRVIGTMVEHRRYRQRR